MKNRLYVPTGTKRERTNYWPRLTVSLMLLSLLALPAAALEMSDGARIPHINDKGKEGFTQFLFSGMHRAFAIAPGGAWAWHSGEASAEAAKQKALQKCQKYSRNKCIAYAVDDELVFDQAQWYGLWGPYKNRTEAARAPTGTRLGERFPDLAFKSGEGQPLKLSDFSGNVVLLHFWGSWCPPCCRELPDLQKLSNSLSLDEKIEVVMLQVRESYSQSQAWAKKLDLPMDLYDSGVAGEDDSRLTLAGGEKIEDRELASRFPTTFVLDGNGLVVFSHRGAAKRWNEYLPFLRDTAAHTAHEDNFNDLDSVPLAAF